MKFRVERAGAQWQGQERLADLCEIAWLSEIQAEVTRLAVAKKRFEEIAQALTVPVSVVRDQRLRAEKKLRGSHAWLVQAMRRELQEVIECVRNVRDTRSSPVFIYRAIPGGYDRHPITLRPRPDGGCPEDFLDEPGRLLRCLPRLIGSVEEGAAAT